MSEVERLDALAARINAEHRACLLAALDTLEHALNAGDLLLQAKAECPHGTWLVWLQDNFEGSVRTAQVYMRLTRNRIVLEAAKAQGSAFLSIDGALQALAEPKPPPAGTPRVPDLSLAEMQGYALAPNEEAEERLSDADFVLRGVAELLNGALAPELALRPKEAGEALARAKDGGRLTEDLRNGVAWLARVLEEAESTYGQDG